MHDGLIILVPLSTRSEQIRLFELVLDFIATLPDTTNRLIEIFSDGEIKVRDWFDASSDPDYTAATGRAA